MVKENIKILEEIIYLESLIEDLLEGGQNKLALEKQAELDKLNKRIEANRREKRKSDEEVFTNF